MAHKLQQDYLEKVKQLHPKYFSDVKILDIGSLDINGNNKFVFEHPYYYIGLDLGEGPNVDVICPGHLYDSGFLFDVTISTECFEHDPEYDQSLIKIYSMLKPNGLFVFTCASTGRAEHGTRKSDSGSSLGTIGKLEDMYNKEIYLQSSNYFSNTQQIIDYLNEI